jgi:hypothetical protein
VSFLNLKPSPAPLASLEPDEQRTVWEEAVKTAPEGKVTTPNPTRVKPNLLKRTTKGGCEHMEKPVNRKRPSPDKSVLNPIGLLKDLQLEVLALRKEVAEIKALLNLKEAPTPEIAEIQNRITFNRAMSARNRGEKHAIKKFLEAGGIYPKLRLLVQNREEESEVNTHPAEVGNTHR